MNQPEGPSAGYNVEFGVVRYLNGSSGGWVDVEAPWHDCWAHQCQEAIDLVEGTLQGEPISDAQHGRKVQEVMMALFESARQRQRIDLPLKTRVNPLGLMVEQGRPAGALAGARTSAGRAWCGVRRCPGTK